MSRTAARPRSCSRGAFTVTGTLAAGIVASLLAGCSSSSSSNAATATGTGSAHGATVTITAAHGCTPSTTSLAAGGATFAVTNKDATAVNEVELLDGDRIVGEKENLPPGFSGNFSANLDAGTYTLYCPGAPTERTSLTVTGTAASTGNAGVSALLAAGTTAYAAYVNDQVGELVASVQKLNTALNGTDVVAAQDAYIAARPYYEKIEPVAESFTEGSDSLDADIDARANDVPAAQWKGFHRIEKGLFQDKSLAGLAPLGAGLVANVAKLTSLTATLTYQPTELANGAQELLDEVASSKITGEEERYSHIDILDMAGNIEGSQQAFAQLQPALATIDSALTTELQSRFTALGSLIDTFRTGKNSSGFVLYNVLTTADKRAIAAAVKAVQEPLSTVGAKIAGS